MSRVGPPEEREAAAAIRARLGAWQPRVAVVLGSGLGGFVERLREPVRIAYAEIPYFPVPTVAGHGKEIVVGLLGEIPVLVQSGRLHLYEGHSPEVVALPVRTFAALGTDTIVLTNAAGAVHAGLAPGMLLLIADHLNLTGRNPLVGPVRPGEARFPDTSDLYDTALRAHTHAIAARRGVPLTEGVYAGLLGPSYETPAEIRMLARLGADAVGMSTVIEALAAGGSGMRCLGLSVIANAASGVASGTLSHQEVLAAAGAAGEQLGNLLTDVITTLPPVAPRRG